MDEDSDFMLFTNHSTIVECAKKCYEEYPTVVNALQESGITYNNTMTDYSNMDNKFAGSKMGIGWSSNLAQLAMTYYWTEKAKNNPDEEKLKELYDNFIILSVLAQVIIDGCKREYEIIGEDEIKRISKLPCMTLTKEGIDKKGNVKNVKCDFPAFMKYTKEIKYTKDGKEIPYEEISEKKAKLKGRINYGLYCPMNWLEEWLDKIQGSSTSDTTPTEDFFVKMKGRTDSRKISKMQNLVQQYDCFAKNTDGSIEYFDLMVIEFKKLLDDCNKIKSKNILLFNRLIELSLGIDKTGNRFIKKNEGTKCCRKMLNVLYRIDKDKFLQNFC